jgi:hypothetical protein
MISGRSAAIVARRTAASISGTVAKISGRPAAAAGRALAVWAEGPLGEISLRGTPGARTAVRSAESAVAGASVARRIRTGAIRPAARSAKWFFAERLFAARAAEGLFAERFPVAGASKGFFAEGSSTWRAAEGLFAKGFFAALLETAARPGKSSFAGCIRT